MRVLEGREPEAVFRYFEEISRIPRGSGNEEQISGYLVAFAREHGLRYRQDEQLNVIIWKDGSLSHEDREPVILQGHMDMVAVRDPGVKKDMDREGLTLLVEGDDLTAEGTSLGGDDGIAVAYMLAILADDALIHPPIEAVFTTGEEVGLTGAFSLDISDLRGRRLLNIDSEDEGRFTVSSAGGADVECDLPLERKKCKGTRINLRIEGLKGGHSGVDIHKGYLNAVLAMGRLLFMLSEKHSFRIVHVEGGEKNNAIPTWAEASILLVEDEIISDSGEEQVTRSARKIFEIMQREYRRKEPDMKLLVSAAPDMTCDVMSKESAEKVSALLMCVPSGVGRMNPEIPDMVQTSLNLGILRSLENKLTLTFSVRSSSLSEKENQIYRLQSLMKLSGGCVKVSGTYPGWEYRPRSEVRDVFVKAYVSLFGKEPVIEGIHAGLECGIFAEKLPGLDAISFGPQMYDVHTPRERVKIESVRRTFELLKKALEMMA